jgi:hypothetical protein
MELNKRGIFGLSPLMTYLLFAVLILIGFAAIVIILKPLPNIISIG